MTPGQGSPGQNSGIHEKYGSGYKNEHTVVHACSRPINISAHYF